MRTIHPMQWEHIPQLHDAPDLDLSDTACMDEVRSVLARHGKLARFALHLVHKHIELAPGEVLVERPDPISRTQHVTVERLDDVPNARPTTWIFGESGDTTVYCACETVTEGSGCLWHSKLTVAILEKESLLTRGGVPRVVATAMWGSDEQETLAWLDAHNAPDAAPIRIAGRDADPADEPTAGHQALGQAGRDTVDALRRRLL